MVQASGVVASKPTPDFVSNLVVIEDEPSDETG
jgi:hypothetical protein